MITTGADTNTEADTSSSRIARPLSEALLQCNANLVSLLLNADAISKAKEIRSRLLLCYFHPIAIVKALILAGANVNASQAWMKDTDTALNVAVRRRDFDLTHLLLEFGADVNNPETRRNGGTALEVAAGKRDIQMLSYLLDHGADPNDDRALARAAQYNVKLMDLLWDRHKVRYSKGRKNFGCIALAQAIDNNDKAMVRTMLERKVNGDIMLHSSNRRRTTNSYSNLKTAFGRAITQKQNRIPGLVEMLLQSGCNVSSVVSISRIQTLESHSGNLETALLAAARTKNYSTVELFL